MIDVYNIIKQINEQKKETNKSPFSALYGEVMNEVNKQVKQEINSLVSDRKVNFHQTINSVSFDVVEVFNNSK